MIKKSKDKKKSCNLKTQHQGIRFIPKGDPREKVTTFKFLIVIAFLMFVTSYTLRHKIFTLYYIALMYLRKEEFHDFIQATAICSYS